MERSQYELCVEVLRRLDRTGVLKHIVLVGSWCTLLYREYFSPHAYGLVITSHQRGLLPTLLECSTTPALLQEIVSQLQPQDGTITAEFLDSLYNRHQGNLRACLRELYDLCAARDSV